MAYESAYTGQQIDEAVGKVISGQAVGPAGPPGPAGADGRDGAPGPKGDPGETPYIGENGNWWIGTTDTGVSAEGSGGGGVAGVSSFKGRTGAVQPAARDYTAVMVGARPNDWMPSAADIGAATIEQVNEAIQSAVLDSWNGSY